MHLFFQKPDKLEGGVRRGLGEITKHQEAVIQATETALSALGLHLLTHSLSKSLLQNYRGSREEGKQKKGEVLQRET